MKKPIQITIVLLFYAANAIPQALPTVQQSPTVTVKVTDEQGAVIAKTLVVLHADALERDNPKPFNLDVRTSSNGEAKVILPSGFFDILLLRQDSHLTVRNCECAMGSLLHLGLFWCWTN